jgi:YbgC/YbaW family acyl-CoA thioester hydrolase
MNKNKIFEYEILIRECHLDNFGHVNNSIYVSLYEEARWDFITKNGYGLDHVLESQKGPVILDLQVRFKREIKNRETIKILSQAIEVMSSKVLILEQKIIKADGKIASEATFTIGFFDLKERKLIPASEDWLRATGIHL